MRLDAVLLDEGDNFPDSLVRDGIFDDDDQFPHAPVFLAPAFFASTRVRFDAYTLLSDKETIRDSRVPVKPNLAGIRAGNPKFRADLP